MSSEGLGRKWRRGEVGEDPELLKPLSKGQAVSEKIVSCCMPSAWRQTDMRNAKCGVQSALYWHIALLMGLKTKKVRDYNSSLGRRRAEGGVWVLLWLAGVERTRSCFLCGNFRSCGPQCRTCWPHSVGFAGHSSTRKFPPLLLAHL